MKEAVGDINNSEAQLLEHYWWLPMGRGVEVGGIGLEGGEGAFVSVFELSGVFSSVTRTNQTIGLCI